MNHKNKMSILLIVCLMSIIIFSVIHTAADFTHRIIENVETKKEIADNLQNFHFKKVSHCNTSTSVFCWVTYEEFNTTKDTDLNWNSAIKFNDVFIIRS